MFQSQTPKEASRVLAMSLLSLAAFSCSKGQQESLFVGLECSDNIVRLGQIDRPVTMRAPTGKILEMSESEILMTSDGGLRAAVTVHRLLASGDEPLAGRLASAEYQFQGISSLHVAVEGGGLFPKGRLLDASYELLIDCQR